jgi:L-rhamnose isomerase
MAEGNYDLRLKVTTDDENRPTVSQFQQHGCKPQRKEYLNRFLSESHAKLSAVASRRALRVSRALSWFSDNRQFYDDDRTERAEEIVQMLNES